MEAFLFAVGPFAIVATKLTDLCRNAFDHEDNAPSFVWNIVPMAWGVAIALLWELQFQQMVPGLPPVLAHLTGVSGEILTGLGIGAVAGGWHEAFDALSGVASNRHATAQATLAQLPPAQEAA